MNNKFFLRSVLAGVLLLPSALYGQASATASVQTPQVRIDAALSEAGRLQLPVSELKNKVAEGRAKNVAPEKIAAVVEARLKTLAHASELLTRMNVTARNSGEVVLLADALDAGIRENIAVETLRSIPADRREVTMSTLTYMVRSGVVSQLQLADLKESSIPPEQLAWIIANWDDLMAANRKRLEDARKKVEEALKIIKEKNAVATPAPLPIGEPAVPPIPVP